MSDSGRLREILERRRRTMIGETAGARTDEEERDDAYRHLRSVLMEAAFWLDEISAHGGLTQDEHDRAATLLESCRRRLGGSGQLRVSPTRDE